MTISWLGPFFSLTCPKECLDFPLLPFCKPYGDITNFSGGQAIPRKDERSTILLLIVKSNYRYPEQIS